jgi:hypothetical protein
MASTISLSDVVRYARQHGELAPLTQVGGTIQQPALDLCNDVLLDILTSPNDWRWNQAEMTILVTCANKQDYLFAGASAFVLSGLSGLTSGAAISMDGITVANNTVTVSTMEPHRFKIGNTVYLVGNVMTTGDSSAYNSIYFDDGIQSGWLNGWVITAVSPTSFSFAAVPGQNNADAGGAPGITDFGWLASAFLRQMDNHASPQYGYQITAVKDVQPTAQVGDPEKVSIYTDYGDGTIKVRFSFVPSSTSWGCFMIYQKRAPLKVSLSQMWEPIPDNFIHLCRQGIVYRMYRYLNKTAQANIEYQKFQADVAKAQRFDDNEESDVHIIPESFQAWW